MATPLNPHLRTGDDKRIVAIEHEFDAIDIDPVDSTGVAATRAIVEMFKGCTCCAALDVLQAAPDKLLITERGQHANIIETIGLTDPVSIEQSSFPAEPAPGEADDTIVTVVDTACIDQQLPANICAGVEIKAEEQHLLAVPDYVLLSKTARHDEAMSSMCLKVENPIVIGHREPFLLPVWARSESPIAIGLVDPWIKSLMHDLGDSLFRHRGVLHVKGCDKKYVVLGDRKGYQGMFTNMWASNEKRESKFVFVGRNLPRAKIYEEFLSLIAKELRFAVGARVMAQVGKFRSGTVVKQWDDGNAYRIRLDRKGGDVFAPIDTLDYVHATDLRFPVGSKVLANVGEFKLGTVINHWNFGNAYRIRLDRTGEEVWGPIDTDDYVKAPTS
jgi:G3E family GTPase